MEVLSCYPIEVSSNFAGKIPENYPLIASADKIDSAFDRDIDIGDIKKLKKYSYPFFTIAILELGEDTDCFRILEGSYFIKLAMKFLSEGMVLKYAGKQISDFNIYAIDLSETSNQTFQPFLNDWIKRRFEMFPKQKEPKIELILLSDVINVYIPENKLNKNLHFNKLWRLLNVISDEDKKIVSCFKQQIEKIPFWETSCL